MIFAIVERQESIANEKPFVERYYMTNFLRETFDELDVLLFPVVSEKNLEKVCDICDGLLVPGSVNDVNPAYYNEEPIAGKNYDKDEYKLDQKIISMFAERNKPILGICGGLQSINVCFGGSLYQKIEGHWVPGEDYDHMMAVKEGSFLHEVYGDSAEINSYHCQAVKDPAPSFTVTGVADDGTVEAMERGNIVGIQWHPEVIGDTRFFKMFLEKFLNY